jgi:flagellar motor switch protein FliN/FliY
MDNNKKTAQEFAALFADALAASVALFIGQPWPLEVAASAEPATDNRTPLHFRLQLEGSLRGECYAEFYEPQIALLVEKSSQQLMEMTPEERAGAFIKVISGAIPVLTESLSAAFGPVTLKSDRVAGLAFGGMFVVSLAAPADPSGLPILLYFDTRLLESLGSSARGNADERHVNPNNLKLVMDVELNVSLLFGRRQLPLREVLELTSGSVVELDRMVHEPVELLLDGKVIARGEAVIVDGNYGLRVTEIPQPVSSQFLN